MDELHSVTLFLMRYGYWLRGTALGFALYSVYQLGILDLSLIQQSTSVPGLFIPLMILGLLAPSLGDWVMPTLWQKVTPINDRITYIENELVYAGSAMFGVTLILVLWADISILQSVSFTAMALTLTFPALLAIFLIKRTLNPISERDTSADVAAARTFREETPHFWSNALAYIIAGVVAGSVMTASIFVIVKANGGGFAPGAEFQAFVGIVMLNILSAPIFVWIGRKLRSQDTEPKGYHFSLGATVVLKVIVFLNLPVILKNGTDLQGILQSWHFGAAYCLMVLSYISGGIAFSKFYKPRPISFEFV